MKKKKSEGVVAGIYGVPAFNSPTIDGSFGTIYLDGMMNC